MTGDRAVGRTVVHLITTLTSGGAERMLSQLVPRPGERSGERHVVVSLAPGGMFAEHLLADGVEVRDLGMRPGRDLLRGTVRLVRLLRELQPVTVVAWLYHACLLATLARPLAGRAAGVRDRPAVVWMLRGSLHTLDGMPWHTRLIIQLLARCSRSPAAIAVNSRTGLEHHARIGYHPRRWTLLTNGCDTDTFRPDEADRTATRAGLGIDPDAVVVLAVFIGRNHPEKGPDLLLDAMAALPPTAPLRLAMIGSGTDRIVLGPEVADRVTLLGERTDIPLLLRGADLLVMPSRTEGTPNALLEAMASGVPCLATDVGDCRSIIGDTGSVVAPEDVAALRDGLERFLALPRHERDALGRAARETVLDRFSLDRARDEYRGLWTEV